MSALKLRRLIVTLLFAMPLVSMAQKMDDVKWVPQPLPSFFKLEKTKPEYPLSDYAFDKYIKNNFNFAILGENVPTTGIKVETAKPSVTLSGILPVGRSKTKIFNLELTAGAKENIAEIFSGNKTSGYFKASIGFNWLWPNNIANYAPLPHSNATDPLTNQASDKQILDTIARINKYVKIALIHKTLATDTFFKYRDSVTFKKIYLKYAEIAKDDEFYKRESPLILQVLGDYGVKDKDIVQALYSFVFMWQEAMKHNNISLTTNESSETMVNRFQVSLFNKNLGKADNIIKLAKDSIADAQIKLYAKRYNSYNLFYANITPSISNTSFHHYENLVGNTLSERNSFVPAVKIGLNWFKRYPNVSGKFLLLTISATPKRTNSLDDLTQVNYKITKSHVKLPDTTKTINEDESGTAYKGNYKVGFGIETSAEFYAVFTKHLAIPGIYLKLGYSFGEPWINQRQIPFEGGLLFNISSKTKDAVNYLSLIPYVAWSNLKSSIDADGASVALHDKFSFGVKLGIPVNIGK